MSEEKVFGEADEVLVFKLYRGDDACSEYGFRIESANPNDSAIYLEQLNVLSSILATHVENAEHAVLHSVITSSRAARIAGAKVKNNILKFPVPDGPPN